MKRFVLFGHFWGFTLLPQLDFFFFHCEMLVIFPDERHISVGGILMYIYIYIYIYLPVQNVNRMRNGNQWCFCFSGECEQDEEWKPVVF